MRCFTPGDTISDKKNLLANFGLLSVSKYVEILYEIIQLSRNVVGIFVADVFDVGTGRVSFDNRTVIMSTN